MFNGFLPFTLWFVLTGSVSAIRIPFRRDVPHSTSVKFSSKSVTGGDDGFGFTNNNAGQGRDIYVGTIHVDGNPYEVQLDTGSSDLWLDTTGVDLTHFTDTDILGFVPYADKTIAQGPILVGNVTFGDFVVGQQAFISAPGTNATSNGDKGLLGIGPPLLSTISQQLATTKYNGNSFLDNVFSFYPDEPNYMTFTLSRSESGVTDGGTFTIGEVPDEFSAINNILPIPVLALTNTWAVLLDAVIVDGQRYTGHGSMPDPDVNITILDTGTALAVAPPYYVDAIYKSVDGAQFDSDSSRYIVPCNAKVDMSIVLGGVAFPVDPIDATLPTQNSDGTIQCLSAFTYGDPSSGFILGDTFLRNVFVLYDFGNWTSVADSGPFVKILSITDSAKADANFESANNARLAQFGNTSSKDSGSKGVKTSGSLENSDGSGSSTVDLSPLMRNSYIIIGLLAVLVFVLIVGIVVLRGNKSYRPVPAAPGSIGEHQYSLPYDTPYSKY